MRRAWVAPPGAEHEPSGDPERDRILEDLVPACGGLAFGHLRMPPPEAAAALFAGEELEGRLQALVELIFDLYERAELDLEVLRREGPSLPVLAHARDTIEDALDALILAAAGDERAIPLARELAGLSVWRALRAAGIDGAAAAEVVVGALAAACRAAASAVS
jgi:hypothetical protein